MTIFLLAPDQTIAQMWSNGVRGVLNFSIFACYTTSNTVYLCMANYFRKFTRGQEIREIKGT